MSAIQQTLARSKKCSIDDLRMSCSWQTCSSNNFLSTDQSGLSVTIDGLLIQGATLQNKNNNPVLRHLSVDSPEFALAPPVSITYTLPSDADLTTSCVNIPVYFTSSRETAFIDLPIPCPKGEERQWILAGVALFIEI